LLKVKVENENKLIISQHVKGLIRKPISFEDGSSYNHVHTDILIGVTGYHIFGLSSCFDEIGVIKFNGTSSWMNPYGHLPGDVYGYLPFYGYMCVVYVIVAIIWCCLMVIYRNSILHIQNAITIVLALCLIEMATWYFNYLYFNIEGIRHKAPFIIGLIMTVSRRSVSILLTLAVSMGYGVVTLTLDNVKNRMIVLGCVYWIFGFLFEALIQYNQTEKEETWMRVLLIPPVAIINGICWWWIFVSLNYTLEYLKIRRQTAKLQMYKWFTSVLVIALLAAIGFAIYEMYYVLKQLYFAQWERLWFMETGFWQILFSVIFFAIMLLWRPSEHFKTYSISQQIAQDEDDIPLDDLPQPDNMDDEDDNDSDIGIDNNTSARFTIDDEDEEQLNTTKENNNINIKTKDTETEKITNNGTSNSQTGSQTMN